MKGGNQNIPGGGGGGGSCNKRGGVNSEGLDSHLLTLVSW